MNKELIKKYKKEFNYWLNGGSLCVLLHHSFEKEWWTTSEHTAVFSNDYSFPVKALVINDEYVEFRKALAEGKTVQYDRSKINEMWSFQDIPNEELENKDISDYNIHKLRIKPEKPKFEVGDWVRFTQTSTQIEQYNGKPYHKNVQVEPWQPQPGEFVIPEAGIVSYSFIVLKWKEGDKYACQPFLGELPTDLKD